jgi:hypothetical protein
MSLPLLAPTPKPPPIPRDEFIDLEHLDRPELDDAPDTERDIVPTLPSLEWDSTDGESGVKRRGT